MNTITTNFSYTTLGKSAGSDPPRLPELPALIRAARPRCRCDTGVLKICIVAALSRACGRSTVAAYTVECPASLRFSLAVLPS